MNLKLFSILLVLPLVIPASALPVEMSGADNVDGIPMIRDGSQLNDVAGWPLAWTEEPASDDHRLAPVRTGTIDVEGSEGPYPILLKTATITPDAGTLEPGNDGMSIVQFDGPIRAKHIEWAASNGIVLYEYLPMYSFLARVDLDAGIELAGAPITAIIPFTPSMKLICGPDHEGDVVITIIDGTEAPSGLEPGNDAETVVLGMGLSGKDIRAIAELPQVRWISALDQAYPANNVSTHAIMALDVHELGLTGFGQTVAVFDSGLDMGRDLPNMHVDLHGAIDVIYDIAADGAEDWNGHGTHVTGTIAGRGTASNGTFDGVAPDVRIVFQAAETIGGSWATPVDMADILQPAYDAGARVHSNSWRAWAWGEYDVRSSTTDAFVHDNKDMVVVAAVGNEGDDGDDDGEIDLDAIGSPATAKNAISVGATENEVDEGGYSDMTYYEKWGSDYETEPIRSDLISDSLEGLAGFSSRGPTDDNRIKPDIVAPGTDVISVKSQLGTEPLWGNYSSDYIYAGGTSMATPVVSAAAAIVRQYYSTIRGHDPSAALVKAVLINGADDMEGQYSSGGTGANGAAESIPNYHEGWGRLNLTGSLRPEHPRGVLFWDGGDELDTGENVEYEITTVEADEVDDALRISLVYSDHEASSGATVALVNDIDLKVTDPEGNEYKGNVFNGSWSSHDDDDSSSDWDVDSNGYDERNNVECVYIEDPIPGDYTIEVRGANCPYPQDYALVASGVFGPNYRALDISFDTTHGIEGGDIDVTVNITNDGTSLPFTTGTLGRSEMEADLGWSVASMARSAADPLWIMVGEEGHIAIFEPGEGITNISGSTGAPFQITDDLYDVAFAPNGSFAIIVGGSGAYHWSPVAGLFKVLGTDNPLLGVAFHPSEGYCLMVGDDGRIFRYPSSSTTTLFKDDMESGSGNWTHSGTNNEWELGDPSEGPPVAHSGNNVWATDLDGDYPSGSNMSLQRHFDLDGTTNPVLTFWHYRELEGSEDDGCIVEGFEDFKFERLDPERGYDGEVNALEDEGFHLDIWGWRKETVYLKQLAAESMTIRFRLESDSSGTGPGWFIDDVKVVDMEAEELGSGTNARLTGVAFNDDGAVVIVGENGTIIEYGVADRTNPGYGDLVDVATDGTGFITASDGGLVLEVNGTVNTLTDLSDTVTSVGYDRFRGEPLIGGEERCWFGDSFDEVDIDANGSITGIVVPERYGFAVTDGGRLIEINETYTDLMISFRSDGSQFTSVLIPSNITSGGVVPITVTWTDLDEGIHNVSVVIDPSEEIAESNDTDNTVFDDLVVLPPEGPYILLVDDDKGENNDFYYRESIEATGLEYRVWDAQNGTPSREFIDCWDIVIWQVGDGFENLLNDSDRSVIQYYLENGGRLFMSGQDIGYTAYVDGWNAWFNNWLKATLADHDVDVTRVISAVNVYNDSNYSLDASRPSAISPAGGARTFLRYDDDNSSAIGYTGDHRVIYWGFGLDQIDSSSGRDLLMNRTLRWMLDDTVPSVGVDSSGDTGTTGEPFLVEVGAGDEFEMWKGVVEVNFDGAISYVEIPWTGNEVAGNVTVPDTARNMSYRVVVYDSAGNTNRTGWRNVTVLDGILPEFTDITTGTPSTDGAFQLRAWITDNWDVVNASAEVRYSNGDVDNVTMYENIVHRADLTVPEDAAWMNYTFWAYDEGGNLNSSASRNVTITDTILPWFDRDLSSPVFESGSPFRLRGVFMENLNVTRVEATYWFDGIPESSINLTFEERNGSAWTFSAEVYEPNASSDIHYRFQVWDGPNTNSSVNRTRTLKDTTPPVFGSDLSGSSAICKENFTFEIEVWDNRNVSDARVVYRLNDGVWANISLHANATYWLNITIPDDAVTLEYSFWATDLNQSWNATSVVLINVTDPTPPTVQDLTSGKPKTGRDFNVKALFTDNTGFRSKRLNYSFGGAVQNVEFDTDTLTISVPDNATEMTYVIWAEDLGGNVVALPERQLDVDDDKDPEIISISAPSTIGPRKTFRVNITTTDNRGIGTDGVTIEYWYDNRAHYNETLWLTEKVEGGGVFVVVIPEAKDARNVRFFLTVEDTSGNWNSSDVVEIKVDQEEESEPFLTTMMLGMISGVVGIVLILLLAIVAVRKRKKEAPYKYDKRPYEDIFECPTCGKEVRVGQGRCGGCNSVLDWGPLECEVCGASIKPDDVFCPKCGNNLAGE